MTNNIYIIREINYLKLYYYYGLCTNTIGVVICLKTMTYNENLSWRNSA